MKAALHKLAALFFRNFGSKLLALTIAVAIWALVASEADMATFATVRLEYKNLPDGLEISSEPVDTILLELRGPSGELGSLGQSGGLRPGVVLDMSNVRPGERTFMIAGGNVKLSRGVRLIRAIPSEVRFTFDRRASRSVPIEVVFVGQGDGGYVVDRYAVSPRHVDVMGPATRVARIKAAVTDPIDVSNVVGSSEFRVNAFVNDPYVRLQSAAQVMVAVTMKKK
jgi:hypothetical protein